MNQTGDWVKEGLKYSRITSLDFERFNEVSRADCNLTCTFERERVEEGLPGG